MKKVKIGTETFDTQDECEKYTRSILKEIGITNSVKNKNEEYFNFLFLLCQRHPDHVDKLNKFLDFQILQDVKGKSGLALNIVNNDNTYTEISWRTCVTGKRKPITTLFNSALRECVSYQIKKFRDDSDLSKCIICDCSLDNKTPHIDHEIHFIKLVEDFMRLNKNITMPITYKKKDITFETIFDDKDKWIGESFAKYHADNAILRVLCETCNLTREKYKKIAV